MLNNTYCMYLVCSRIMSRVSDEMFFNYSWWKCHTASELGKDQMDHSTGPILVWFWHLMALHCIAPSWSKGPQGSSRSHRDMWLNNAAGYLNYPSCTPVPAVTTDVRPAVSRWASYYSPWTESEMGQRACVKLAGSFVWINVSLRSVPGEILSWKQNIPQL